KERYNPAQWNIYAAQDKSIHTIDATQPLEAVMDAIRTTVTHWVKELDA
ncbi:hypothetical protein ACUN9W_24215, partial [Escherichia coli]